MIEYDPGKDDIFIAKKLKATELLECKLRPGILFLSFSYQLAVYHKPMLPAYLLSTEKGGNWIHTI